VSLDGAQRGENARQTADRGKRIEDRICLKRNGADCGSFAKTRSEPLDAPSSPYKAPGCGQESGGAEQTLAPRCIAAIVRDAGMGRVEIDNIPRAWSFTPSSFAPSIPRRIGLSTPLSQGRPLEFV
jgi:hypothetical protein